MAHKVVLLEKSDYGSAEDLEREFEGGWTARDMESYRAAGGPGSESAVLGVKNTDEVLGFMALRSECSNGQRFAYRTIIDRISVRRLHRRSGIGSAMLCAAFAVAGRLGVDALVLSKVPANSPYAECYGRFFRKMGFEGARVTDELCRPINVFARRIHSTSTPPPAA